MKTVTQDPQLDDELQELYLESKHWLSDIHFAEDETRFLKKVINYYLVPGLNNEQLIIIKNFNEALDREDTNIACLKTKIAHFLTFIGSIINETKTEITTDLIEQFAALEIEMKTLFEAVKQIKKFLFLFAEDVMKAGCDAFVSQL